MEEISADDVLEEFRGQLKQVVILGYSKTGVSVCASNTNRADIVMSLLATAFNLLVSLNKGQA